ncbi:hypothetical protein [Micromonospora sp. DT227]|uniref:hypothetical protein n=1 Tax=Micromonospora sp. DT227 TaxID=3393433 RepID=UPI003CF96F7A
MLNGKHTPKWAQVQTFVRIIVKLRDGQNFSSERCEEEVRGWLQRWTSALAASPAPPIVEYSGTSNSSSSFSRPADASGGAANRDERRAGRSVSGEPSVDPGIKRPRRIEILAPHLRSFHNFLSQALSAKDEEGRVWSAAKYGCYAFYDVSGDAIWIGSTTDRLRSRIARHLTSLRSDAVAAGLLDVREVAELELWPLWGLEKATRLDSDVRQVLASVESQIYRLAELRNNSGPPLSSPPYATGPQAEIPPSSRFGLLDEPLYAEMSHPDVRIRRYAENLAQLTAGVLERGSTSMETRRAIVIRAKRLTAAVDERFRYVAGGDISNFD